MPDSHRTIAVYGNISQETLQRTMTGLLRYCEEIGGLVVRDFRLEKYIEELDTKPPPWRDRADGVIINMGIADVPAKVMADWVLSGGVPAVSVAHDWFDPRIPAAFVDADSVVELAIDHLIECECQSFLYVGYEKSTGSGQRGKHFRQGLTRRRRRGVSYAMEALLLGSYEAEELARADEGLTRHLRTMQKPLGILALNDHYARAVCQLCAHLGLLMPDEVKVVGVDDLSIARTSRPTLTTVRTPRDQVGYTAMRMLHRLMDGKPPAAPAVPVPATELIIRESSSGPPVAPGDMNSVMEYIDRHACDGAGVDELVQMVGVSRRAFEIWFRAKVGCSPGRHIQRVRLERARELLSRTEISMARIASMVGFEEPTTFSRFFRKCQGMSPRSFREQNAHR
ncbi:MAG TPA: substrate-binding domain-containing protein [Tepidisphaeraceae bacterium]|nr:substrate-binding domain-containing protein [Tepidisphaeraceae bacterium]